MYASPVQAYASVMRTFCEADAAHMLPLTAAVCDRAVLALLGLVQAGLDLSLPWLQAGIAAGADVLHVVLRRMQQGNTPACTLQRQGSSSDSFHTAASSLVSSWCLVSMPPRSTFKFPATTAADTEATAAAAAAAAAAIAAARAAAAENLVEQSGLLSDLMQLISLGDARAQLAGLSCLAMLACSPISAAAILEHASTVSVLTAGLASGPAQVKVACLTAAEATVQHSVQAKECLGDEEMFMTALAGASLAYPQASDLHTMVSLLPDQSGLWSIVSLHAAGVW